MKVLLLMILLNPVYGFVLAQNVGIGTSTPNSNAILDLSSTNKGLLLPRIADTTGITTPAAGMMIYNQSAKAPNYYDGARWNKVNDPSGNFVPLYGSMTYTVTGTTVGGIPWVTTEVAGIDFSNYSFVPGIVGGTSTPQKADSATFYKEFDGNSIPFKRALLAGTIIPSIEITQYLPDNTKLYSIKLTNFAVTSQFNLISEKTGKLIERYGFSATIIGYKDWINNKSFSYNTMARSFGVY